MSGSRALRRGLTTLVEVIVVREWVILALRGTISRDWGWLQFGAPLALLLCFDLRPFRSGGAEIRLGRGVGWLMISRFVAMVLAMAYGEVQPGVGPPVIQTTIALGVLIVTGAVLRWIDERNALRLIRAAPDGGFLVLYPADAGLDREVEALPGGVRRGSQWEFPATAEAAEALVKFARERHFEFTK